MIYTTYFEMCGQVLESHVSSISSVPSGVRQIVEQPLAVRNGQAKRFGAASPKAFYQPAYTISVGQGNPMFWLGASVLVRSLQIIQPETMTAF